MQFYAFFIPTMLCLAFTVTILVRLARVANHRYARCGRWTGLDWTGLTAPGVIIAPY